MVLKKGLINLIVGKRDPREEEIKILLARDGKDYLKEAIKIKESISRDRGTIYFEKYPEISNQIDEVSEELNTC